MYCLSYLDIMHNEIIMNFFKDNFSLFVLTCSEDV